MIDTDHLILFYAIWWLMIVIWGQYMVNNGSVVVNTWCNNGYIIVIDEYHGYKGANSEN